MFLLRLLRGMSANIAIIRMQSINVNKLTEFLHGKMKKVQQVFKTARSHKGCRKSFDSIHEMD